MLKPFLRSDRTAPKEARIARPLDRKLLACPMQTVELPCVNGVERVEDALCRGVSGIGIFGPFRHDREVVVFGEMRYGPLLNLGKVAGIAHFAAYGIGGMLERIPDKPRVARLDVVYEVRDGITVEAIELAEVFGLVDKSLGFRRMRTERGKQAAQAIDVGGTVRGG